MNILITGGAGFIGSNTAEYLVDRGHTITIVDNLSSGFTKNIAHLLSNKSVRFFNVDIRDKEQIKEILSSSSFDICINYAALISVAESFYNPLLTEEINTIALINLYDLCGQKGIKKIIHISSAAIYGDSPELPKKEDMLPVPKSPYAVTKLSGEYYNSFFASRYGYIPVNFRFFNVFGRRQNPESQYAAAVPIFIRKALSGDNITIYGDGCQTRDFIYVDDLVSAIDSVAIRGNNFSGTFNVGYGKYISIKEIAEFIIKKSGSFSKILFADERPGDIKHSYSSIDNLKRTGWSPEIGFEEGIIRTIDYFRSE